MRRTAGESLALRRTATSGEHEQAPIRAALCEVSALRSHHQSTKSVSSNALDPNLGLVKTSLGSFGPHRGPVTSRRSIARLRWPRSPPASEDSCRRLVRNQPPPGPKPTHVTPCVRTIHKPLKRPNAAAAARPRGSDYRTGIHIYDPHEYRRGPPSKCKIADP
jgi:hypothetical protein